MHRAADARTAGITVVVNPRSGGSSSEETIARIETLLAATGRAVKIFRLEGEAGPQELRALCQQAGAVVAAGGDGTVNAVASVLAGTDTPMGVLPIGTLNHFARDLKIPLDLEQAIGVIAAGHLEDIDAGLVNEHLFVNNCSLGVYPAIVQVRDKLQEDGYAKWRAFMLAARAALRRYPRLKVRLAADRRASAWRTPFVLVGNNEYDVAGVRMIGRSSLQQGQLFAYLAPDVRTSALPGLLAKEIAHRLFRKAGNGTGAFRVISGAQFSIDARGPRQVQIAVDGEVVETTLPLRCSSQPGALRVFLPAPE